MAELTESQITIIRLRIDDKVSEDFSDTEINIFWNEVNSMNYVLYNLFEILITRLRRELLEKDGTGAESTTIASLKSRMELLQSLYDLYKEKYEAEIGMNTGRYMQSTKPTIAGGDI